MGQIILQKDIVRFRNKYQFKIIVAACGCFDIFHIGHLDYLTGAKKLGDIIFVGVNSNRSILANKGEKPIFSADQRMNIIAALSCVDFVFCFDEKTFDNTLKLLKPNIFARGIDAKEKGFPEENTVKDLNIIVNIVGDYKKSSSRELRKYYE